MNSRLLLAPAAAFALLAFAAPASAQSIDPKAQLRELRREVIHHRTAVDHVQRIIARCETPDLAEVEALANEANSLSRQVGSIAWQLPGNDHALALNLQSTAETNYWRLTNPQIPDRCYVPPAA